MTASKIDYAAKGDFWNIVSLLLTLSFTLSALFLRDSGLFDPEWTKEGFCIANSDVDFFSSHDTAFYVDVVLFLVLMYLRSQWKDLPQMQGPYAKNVPMHAVGMLGHGMGHASMAYAQREGTLEDMSKGGFNWNVTPYFIAGYALFFWFPILRPTLYRWSSVCSFVVSLVVAVGQVFLGTMGFQFIYVQTVIMLCFGANELSLPLADKQSYHYYIVPVVTAIPIMLTGWVESVFCNTFYKAIGGHCLFDASIGITFIVYYNICYYDFEGLSEETMTKAKKIK